MYSLIVIGGGAAGFFGALTCAAQLPEGRVLILEKGRQLLGKVKISGGGRCNVTHACFDPRELTGFYPRGNKELRGPFHRFAPGDTFDWFEKRDVPLKIEADGRVFPVSDSSQSIIDCFLQEARKLRVEIETGAGVEALRPPREPDDAWKITLKGGEALYAQRVLLATGSSSKAWKMLENLGMEMKPPVPSLFTFNIKDARLEGLPGLSVPRAVVRIPEARMEEAGPLLITHWGLSGPAVLKLSAWAARELHVLNYRFELIVDWTGGEGREGVLESLREYRREQGGGNVQRQSRWPEIPRRLWARLLSTAGIGEQERWADLSKKQLVRLAEELGEGRYSVDGKSTFKEEFVTAGGVELKEIDFRRFESKKFPGLFLAGEVLDIDAVTGGFNFQAAWTGGYIAGLAIAEDLRPQPASSS